MLHSSQRDNYSLTRISRKAHFTWVTEVVERRQMCWNFNEMQHVCSKYATNILMICIGHFSVKRFAGKCPFLYSYNLLNNCRIYTSKILSTGINYFLQINELLLTIIAKCCRSNRHCLLY